MTNEEIIWTYLNERLKNPYGTAAMMGNLFAESSLNPILANNIKKHGMTNETYTAAVDEHKNDNFVTDGIAYGLAQWCYHTRKKGLLDKAKAVGKSIGDIYLQLEYLWNELQLYKTVINALYDAKDIRTVSDVVLTKYEKPANQSEAVKIKRAGFGQKYFDKYASIEKIQIKIKRSAAKELEKKLGEKLK